MKGHDRLGAAGRGGLRPGLRHDRLGRCDRAATRGRGPARSFRRRGDGRGDPVRAGRRGARLFRPEGCPAGDGDPADGPRPRPADRGDRLPHGPRAGRARPVVTQRPPVTRRTRHRAGASGGPCRPPASSGAGRALGRGHSGARSGFDAGGRAPRTARVRLGGRRVDVAASSTEFPRARPSLARCPLSAQPA